jgi:hypothetical protein
MTIQTYHDLVMENWYGGAPPSYSEEETNQALAALCDLWPEMLQKLSKERTHYGPIMVVPVIRDGLLISRCRDLVGFSDVLARWRLRDLIHSRSARSEVVMAEALLTFGLPSDFVIDDKNSKNVDLKTHTDPPVFIEVIAPDQAKSVKEAIELLLQDRGPGIFAVRVSDERASKALNRETNKHFSKECPNILAVNVNAVPKGLEDWRQQLAAILTPRQYTRVGPLYYLNSIPAVSRCVHE